MNTYMHISHILDTKILDLCIKIILEYKSSMYMKRPLQLLDYINIDINFTSILLNSFRYILNSIIYFSSFTCLCDI
jgi:hypothetical protein